MSRHKGVGLPAEYDTLNVGLALYDPAHGTILDANERFGTLLGYSTDQLRELSVEAYTANTFSKSDTEFRERLQASAAGSSQQFTWRAKRADGELIWVQVYLSKDPESGHAGVRAEVRDITDQFETRHREELFWRVIRHNLRNEAAVIMGSADRIRTHATTELVQNIAATIQTRADNLGKMADSVNEIEQAVSNIDSQYAHRHATTAVREVAREVEGGYPAAEITIEERKEMGIYVDEAFTHAVKEALENAIVHSEEAWPEVTVRIGPSPNTGRVEISITDTNPPIPDAELTALFSPTDTTPTSHGTGVGLFVMRWCIESLGGEIKFERRDPCGNIISLYLPPKTAPPSEHRSTK